jgi:hypothetical protein
MPFGAPPQPGYGPVPPGGGYGPGGPAPYGGQWAPPGYGAPPAPIASRPGTIPLRPLRLGDIFDGAFRSIRFAPSVMFGLTAVVVTIAAAAQTVPVFLLNNSSALAPSSSSALQAQIYSGFYSGLGSMLSTVIGLVFTFLATTVLSGMLTYAVAQGAIGARVSVASAWRAIGGRVPGLIGLSLLIGLLVAMALAIPIAATLVGIGLIGAELVGESTQSAGLGLVVILAGMLGGLAAYAWIATRTLFAPAALVLEGQGVAAAFRHSWRLTRGRFWRTLGIYMLTSLIVAFLTSIVNTPVAMIGILTVSSNPVLGAVAMALGTAVASLLTTPFAAAVVALLYIDARIRSEGLDLALMRAAEEPRL